MCIRDRVFTIHTPPRTSVPVTGMAPRAAEPVLVPEGFSLAAFLFGPLWFLFKGLWWGLLGWIVLAVAIAFLPGASSSWAGLALALLTGFQARDVQRWTLARRGLPESGVVAGADEEVALLRLGGRSPAGRPA